MFHRRLILLSLVAAVVVLLLSGKTMQLATGASHQQFSAEADDKLKRYRYLPTQRGSIVDRNGKILVRDRPGFDVAVQYEVINGTWAYEQARDAAIDEAGPGWSEMSDEDRDLLTAEKQVAYERQVQMLWQTLAAMGRVSPDSLQARLDRIREDVHDDASYLWDRWRARKQQQIDGEVRLAEVIQPIREERIAHVVLSDVPDVIRVELQGFIAEGMQNEEGELAVWEQVEIRRPTHRRHPFETMTVMVDRSHLPSSIRQDEPLEVTVEGVGLHLFGLLRNVWAEDVRAQPFVQRGVSDGEIQVDLQGYRDGDQIGSFGIEASMEPMLRGARGRTERHLGRGTTETLLPTAGGEVQLTIDIHLQARIQAIMSNAIGVMSVQPSWHPSQTKQYRHAPRDGETLNGAVVVMEVDSGEILAAVSKPTFSLGDLRDDPETVLRDQLNDPFLNRAFGRAYQPGSTVKPFVYAGAVAEGKCGADEGIFCRGYHDKGHNDRYRCWIYKKYLTGHGMLDPAESLAQSCNIYYYTLGERMRTARIVDWYERFGFGQITDSGIYEEVRGDLPRERDGKLASNTRADSIFMGIGQGPVRFTPVQMAAAYSVFGRSGIYLPPTMVVDEHRGLAGLEERQATDLGLAPRSITNVLRGMDMVVNDEEGTGRHLAKLDRELIFDHNNLKIYGKSGTAEAVKLRRSYDDDNDGYPDRWGEVLRDGDHAWFVTLVQPIGAPRPTHVVVVVCEFGGSGSNVAGPVANQVIHALKVEGYLPQEDE